MTAVESSARRTHIAVVDPKYSPACGQGAVHASALVAPTVAEYLPVLQLVQADEPESAYVFVGQSGPQGRLQRYGMSPSPSQTLCVC